MAPRILVVDDSATARAAFIIDVLKAQFNEGSRVIAEIIQGVEATVTKTSGLKQPGFATWSSWKNAC